MRSRFGAVVVASLSLASAVVQFGVAHGAQPIVQPGPVQPLPSDTPKPPTPPPPASNVEDCVAVDGRNVVVEKIGKVDWGVTDHKLNILNFGRDKASAERAAELIRHYRFDQQCVIGRPKPSMSYWKRGARVPVGGYPDEICSYNNPDNTRALRVAGEWRLVDGRRWLLSFGANENQARAAADVVRRYRLNRLCRIASAGMDKFSYWLAE